MQIVSASRWVVTRSTVSMDSAGRESLVVVSKATWQIPLAGQRPRPLPAQPLSLTDQYFGEPGMSPMRYGDDFSRFKPRCDVIFDARAHSPDGRPFQRLEVGWQVGGLRKALMAHGPRQWRLQRRRAVATAPAPVLSVPLHYGHAWGGGPHRLNPVGCGWFEQSRRSFAEGQALPDLERGEQLVDAPESEVTPIAFSAVPRNSLWRRCFAGTYDAAWRRDQFPLVPEDFDERFHQCAPEDQQMDYPQGGEEVILRHMMEGRPAVRFWLPRLDLHKVHVLRRDYSVESPKAVVDTLFFEPDASRFSAVWRASVPIRRRVHEFDTIAVGQVDPAWWLDLMAGRCIRCAEVAS